MSDFAQSLTYFVVPTAISSSSLTGTQKLLYGLIRTVSGMREKKCYLTNNEISVILGLGLTTTREAIYELVDKGLLVVTDQGNRRCLSVVEDVALPLPVGTPTPVVQTTPEMSADRHPPVGTPTPHIEEKEQNRKECIPLPSASDVLDKVSLLKTSGREPKKPKPKNGKVEDFDLRVQRFFEYYPKRKNQKYHYGKKLCVDWLRNNVHDTDTMKLILFAAKRHGEEDPKARDGFAQDPIRWLKNLEWEVYRGEWEDYKNHVPKVDKRDTTPLLAVLSRTGGQSHD